ncbi:uncharacterized protein LOC119436413 [Dermacentor silvarum]|uniref:uncharacterized protein LOC119436413 n=1 Tax=Dermacentor silvarum TaxID=543639 RepID=UPI00189BA638|nr:uncharacterized protein LOC119436413 [Dermacentor silvarum]
MLRNLAANEQQRLLDCFNETWRSGQVPESWRLAIVAPILKARKPAGDLSPTGRSPSPLRPARGFLVDQQTGFRRQRSTADSIANVVSTLEEAKARGNIVLLVLIDIKGAFDGLPTQSSSRPWTSSALGETCAASSRPS